MKTPQAITIRPTPEDYKIVTALCKKLGANTTGVIRQGLRLLARKEKVKA
jgi:hypothetical protein